MAYCANEIPKRVSIKYIPWWPVHFSHTVSNVPLLTKQFAMAWFSSSNCVEWAPWTHCSHRRNTLYAPQQFKRILYIIRAKQSNAKATFKTKESENKNITKKCRKRKSLHVVYICMWRYIGKDNGIAFVQCVSSYRKLCSLYLPYSMSIFSLFCYSYYYYYISSRWWFHSKKTKVAYSQTPKLQPSKRFCQIDSAMRNNFCWIFERLTARMIELNGRKLDGSVLNERKNSVYLFILHIICVCVCEELE